VAAFLLGEWYQELQWYLLQFSDKSLQWEQCAALTAKLVASLQPPDDDADARQALYAIIPEVGPQLRELLSARAHDQQQLEQQVALIEQQHLLLLRGKTPIYAPFDLIANNDPWLSSSTTISSDLLARVDELTPGQWFLQRDPPLENHIKLVLKMDDTMQLLFVNRLGVKALQQSFEEFAYLLATSTVTALPGAPIAAQLLRQLLQQLIRHHAEQHRVREEALAQARQRTDAEARRRVEAKAKAIAEAKALAEAEAIAQANAAAQAQEAAQQARQQELARRQEALQQQQRGDSDQRLRAARQQAALLAIGSWVELHDELGQSQRLKLAVKLPSTGKLIFVDREGIRRAEMVNDQFAARLLDGSASILSQGPQFEDTLAKVVGGMRRDPQR
jgi:hypothetical protein